MTTKKFKTFIVIDSDLNHYTFETTTAADAAQAYADNIGIDGDDDCEVSELVNTKKFSVKKVRKVTFK